MAHSVQMIHKSYPKPEFMNYMKKFAARKIFGQTYVICLACAWAFPTPTKQHLSAQLGARDEPNHIETCTKNKSQYQTKLRSVMSWHTLL